MSWSTFTATYAPSAGPLRLGHWHCTDRPASRLGTRTFQATLALGDRIETATATATGPVAALTAMLYEHGVSVEMLRFHQLQSDDTTATFIQGTDGCRAEWAMGCSEDPTQSALVSGHRLREQAVPRGGLERAQHDRHAVHRDRHAAVVPFRLVARVG